MVAVMAGGVIVIWLGLSGGRALLHWLGVQLHRPAKLIAPLLLALLESLLFLACIPTAELLPEPRRLPVTLALIALAWLLNGAASALIYRRPATART